MLEVFMGAGRNGLQAIPDPKDGAAVTALSERLLSSRQQQQSSAPATETPLPAPIMELVSFFLSSLDAQSSPSHETQLAAVRALRFCASRPNEGQESIIQGVTPLLLSTSAPVRMQVASCLLTCYSTAKSSTICSTISNSTQTIARSLKSLPSPSGTTLRFITTSIRTLNVMIAKTSPLPPDIIAETIQMLGVWCYHRSTLGRGIAPEPPERGRMSVGGVVPPPFGGGAMGSFMPSSSRKSTIPSLSRSSSRSSLASSGSEDDEPKVALSQSSAQIRLDALTCLKTLATSNPKALYSHWGLFIADSPYVYTRCTLLSLAETDPSVAVRERACHALVALLDRSSHYLAIAEDRPTKASFTSLSTKLGEVVYQLHLKITALLSSPAVAASPAPSLMVEILDLARTLAQNSPYGRMHRPLAAPLASVLMALLQSNDDCIVSATCSTLGSLVNNVAALPGKQQQLDATGVAKAALSLLQGNRSQDVQSGAWILLGSSVSHCGEFDIRPALNILHDISNNSTTSLQESQMYFLSSLLRSSFSAATTSISLAPYSESLLAIVRNALRSTRPQVRALGCSALASEGIVEMNSGSDCVKVLDEALRLSRDEESEVRSAACRTIGLLVKGPSFQSEASTLDDVLRALMSRCNDVDPTKSSASWAMANTCDTLTASSAASLDFAPLFRQALPLLDSSNSEKLQTNTLRTIGSLLKVATDAQLSASQCPSRDLLLSTLRASLSSSIAKVVWNAATAISNALSGPICANPSSSAPLIDALSVVLTRSPNYKVRIHATNGILAVNGREAFSTSFEAVRGRVMAASEKVTSDEATVAAKEVVHHNHLAGRLKKCLEHLDSMK